MSTTCSSVDAETGELGESGKLTKINRAVFAPVVAL